MQYKNQLQDHIYNNNFNKRCSVGKESIVFCNEEGRKTNAIGDIRYHLVFYANGRCMSDTGDEALEIALTSKNDSRRETYTIVF